MPDAEEIVDVDAPEADPNAGPDLEAILADEPDVPAPAEADARALGSGERAPESPAAEPPPAAVPPPPAPPASVAPAQDDQRVAEGLAAIMRESRELQEMRRKLEEERQALEPLRKYEGLHRMLEEEDAEGALRELGIDLTEANKAAIEGRGTKGRLAKQLEAKLQEMERQTRERLERVERLEQERVRREAEAEVRSAIAPDRFPLAAAVSDLSVPAVFQKAQEHFQRSGQVPNYDQVIGDVEKELASFVDRLMAVDAIRQRYVSKDAPAKTPSLTLTNNDAATVSKRKAPTTNRELPEDREAAIDFLLAEET